MEPVRNLTPSSGPYAALQKTSLLLKEINFHESLFALPFAYAGMVLSAEGWPTWHQFAWITVAMVSARTVGMSANRVIDRHIDARNPRTAGRNLPRGTLKVPDLAILTMASLGVFFWAASQLNALALALAPVAAAYLVLYPYTKRFTWVANLMLGCALAIAPSAAWIGVKGGLSWEPVLLSAGVALWAGGFDILYHLQDQDFYARAGLHSVGQRFGTVAAFRWARTLDILALACMLALGISMGLAWPYYLALTAATWLLAYKNRLVSPHDISRMDMAFFRINAYVSSIMFAGTLAAVLI